MFFWNSLAFSRIQRMLFYILDGYFECKKKKTIDLLYSLINSEDFFISILRFFQVVSFITHI